MADLNAREVGRRKVRNVSNRATLFAKKEKYKMVELVRAHGRSTNAT